MKIGDIITLDFTTNNPNTGMVQDADLLPICKVFEGDIDVSVFSPTVTKRVGEVGNYRVSIDTFDEAFEVDKSYNAIVEATVAGVTTKSRVGFFVLELNIAEEISKLIQPVMF